MMSGSVADVVAAACGAATVLAAASGLRRLNARTVQSSGVSTGTPSRLLPAGGSSSAVTVPAGTEATAAGAAATGSAGATGAISTTGAGTEAGALSVAAAGRPSGAAAGAATATSEVGSDSLETASGGFGWIALPARPSGTASTAESEVRCRTGAATEAAVPRGPPAGADEDSPDAPARGPRPGVCVCADEWSADALDEASSSAQPTAVPPSTAAPTPRATANPPTRPTCFAAPM